MTHSSPRFLRAAVLAVIFMLAASLLTACQLPDVITNLLPKTEKTAVAAAAEEIPEVIELPEAEPEVLAEAEEAPGEPEEPASINFDGTADSLSGLILFTSTAEDPFAEGSLVLAPSDPGERYLWAISPDGSRFVRISPEGLGTAIIRPAGSLESVVYFSQGFDPDGDPFVAVAPPDDCAENGGDPACGNIQFTTDGRFVAYLHGNEGCGRSLTLWDIHARQAVNTWKGVHWYYVMKDGGLVINMGGCERRYVYNYAPNSGRQGSLGLDGTAYWNPARSAVLWVIQDNPLIKTAVWGLNFDTSKVFARIAEDQAIEDAPAWAPDGEHYLYNRRAFRYDQSSKTFVLEGPRQVILMNAWTRKQKLLAYAPGYNYHICDNASQPCTSWSGDWIQLRRTPFRKVSIRPTEIDMPEARCALFGLDCETPAELFALNWQTGELIPWEEAGLPDPEPAARTAPADLEKAPLYTDPTGEFALYTSRGDRSLWYVPTDGSEAHQLVADGENFVFIP